MTPYPAPPAAGIPRGSNLRRRVAGRLIDGGVAVIQSLLPYMLLAGLIVSVPSDPYAQFAESQLSGAMTAWFSGVALIVLAGTGASLWALLTRGVGLGAALVGLESIDPATGKVTLGRSLYKYLLQGLLSFLTLGIAEAIVSYVTYSRNDDRTWFDRTAGVVVRRRGLPDRTPLAEQAAAPWNAPVISDVGLSGPGGLPASPRPFPADHRSDPTQAAPWLPRPAPEPRPPATTSRSAVSPRADAAPDTAEAARPPRPAVVPEHSAEQVNPYALRSPGDPTPAAPPGHSPTSAVEQVGAAEVAGGYIAFTPFPSAHGTQVPDGPAPRPASVPAPMPTARPVVRERSSDPGHVAMPVESDMTVLAPELLAMAGADVPSRPARLLLPTGESITITGPVVMGRNPVAPPDVPEAQPRPIEDPMRSLSKTHLVVGPAETGVWVIDLHSTNGVSVARTHAEQLSGITPGERIVVPLGGRLRFGSYEAEVLS